VSPPCSFWGGGRGGGSAPPSCVSRRGLAKPIAPRPPAWHLAWLQPRLAGAGGLGRRRACFIGTHVRACKQAGLGRAGWIWAGPAKAGLGWPKQRVLAGCKRMVHGSARARAQQLAAGCSPTSPPSVGVLSAGTSCCSLRLGSWVACARPRPASQGAGALMSGWLPGGSRGAQSCGLPAVGSHVAAPHTTQKGGAGGRRPTSPSVTMAEPPRPCTQGPQSHRL
jgi:hypothetical protein